jgi:hypothetical protein
MRAIWKGSIAFGLVHIPVNLYPATESQSISSNLLHKKDNSRIRYQRVSQATGKEVPAEEIVRGFEVERDNLKSRTIWSQTRAPAKPMPYCAKRSPNPGKSASRNLCCATAKAYAC